MMTINGLEIHKEHILALGFVVAMFSGCATPADGQHIHLTTLAQSQNCDVPGTEPYWLRVENNNDLPTPFATIKSPGPFWLVGLGEKPTGGYSISVAPQAKLHGSELRVETVTTSPRGRVVSQAFTNPCVLLAAPIESVISTSLWLEDGNSRSVAVQPYLATKMQQIWP